MCKENVIFLKYILKINFYWIYVFKEIILFWKIIFLGNEDMCLEIKIMYDFWKWY